MKSRRLFALAFRTCLVAALSPAAVFGQTSTPSTTTSSPSTTSSPVSTTTSRPTNNSSSNGNGNGTGTSYSQNTQLQSSTIGAGSATTIPSNANNLAPWYGDPYSMGLPSKYVSGMPSANSSASRPTVTFNKGNYVSTANTSSSTSPSTTNTTQNGFTTVGILRTPQYATVLSDDIPLVEHKAVDLRANVLDLIARSSKLKSKNNIQVAVNDGAVILTGQVGTDRERQLVEAMIGMTPGVRGVQNELTVTAIK